MASGQLAWMKRHQPERIARATTAFHCKDWLYFNLTGQRVTDPAEANFTFGNYRTRRYEPSILAAMGIGDCERLLPQIVDGASTWHALSVDAAKATGLPQGLPVVLGYLDVVCAGLGSGLYEPAGGVGVSILGSTGMHMRFIATPDDVRLNTSRSGYTMCLPIPGASASMQSNMAATLNIDWLLDVAREAAALAGAQTNRDGASEGHGRAGPRGGARLRDLPSLYPRGWRARAVRRPQRARAILGAVHANDFCGHDARGLRGPRLRGAGLLSRQRRAPARGTARRRRRAFAGRIRKILASTLGASVRTVKREETGAAGAAMTAAVSLGVYRDMAQCAEAWVTPSLGEATEPDPALSALYAQLYQVYRGRARADACGLGGPVENQAGDDVMADIAIIGDRFMLPSMFEAAIRRKCGDRLDDPRRMRCPGRTIPCSTATPRPAWTG